MMKTEDQEQKMLNALDKFEVEDLDARKDVGMNGEEYK
jgi:hypothetical protein